ncbi:hypothetical protein PFC51_19970, partial [Paracoccus pantotrophus]|nr:hypothetical protein [Paracoccus pantotrophus]
RHGAGHRRVAGFYSAAWPDIAPPLTPVSETGTTSHVRAFAQRVVVADDAIYIKGNKNVLLKTLMATKGGKSAGIGVPGFIPKWRRGWD